MNKNNRTISMNSICMADRIIGRIRNIRIIYVIVLLVAEIVVAVFAICVFVL